MILPSINQLNECKLYLRWRYFKEFLYFFLCFSMSLDNNVWYARVGIFNGRTKYTSPNIQYSYNVNFFMNLFNKIKSELKLSLPFPFFFFFWFGCNGTIFIYLHFTCYISLAKAILLIYF